MNNIDTTQIKTINISPEIWAKRAAPNLWQRLLPWLIIIALSFGKLFEATQSAGVLIYIVGAGEVMTDIVFGAIFYGLVEYGIFLLVMWLYRKVLSIKPYYFLVPRQAFDTHFKSWFLLSSVVLGIFELLYFVAPYMQVFGPIMSIICSYCVVLGAYYSLNRYIDIMFRHMYFKLLLTPWFIWQGLALLFSLVWGV